MQERADAARGQEQEDLIKKLKDMAAAEERRLAAAREVAERDAQAETAALQRMREQNELMQAKIDEQEREVQRLEKEKKEAEEKKVADEQEQERVRLEQHQREVEKKGEDNRLLKQLDGVVLKAEAASGFDD